MIGYFLGEVGVFYRRVKYIFGFEVGEVKRGFKKR